MNKTAIVSIVTILSLFYLACSKRGKEQDSIPKSELEKQGGGILSTNTQQDFITKDSMSAIEAFLKEYKRPQKEINSRALSPHVDIGKFVNRARVIQGYYLSNDLILYERADIKSPIVYRDSLYKWSGNSEGSGDGYLVRSQWNILEYTSQWIKVSYKSSVGWINGNVFAANKIVVFDMNGNKFKELLSPFINSGIYTVVAGDDSLSFYVSDYKDYYVKIDLSSGKILDTVGAFYLIDHQFLKKSYIYTHLQMAEEDYMLMNKMQFDPSTFNGVFLKDRVIYINKKTEFHNSIFSQTYETGKIDSLFSFDRIQLSIAYQIESFCSLKDKYIVMPMSAHDGRY